jgi:hypothetical protein
MKTNKMTSRIAEVATIPTKYFPETSFSSVPRYDVTK